MPNVCYVIPAYGGPNSVRDHKDYKGYLEWHFKYLNQTPNSFIEQILIVSAVDNHVSQEYRNFTQEFKKLDNGTPVVLLERENEGWAFGSYNFAYQTYRNKFSHYLVIEQDYMPVLANYDKILIDLLDEKQGDYICQFISTTTWENNGVPHAGVPNGMFSSSAAETIWQQQGSLLYPGISNWYWHNQMRFSYSFSKNGFKIVDMCPTYKCENWYALEKRLIDFNPDGKEHLFRPYQGIRELK